MTRAGVGFEPRVGVDVASIAEVGRSIERFGSRYLDEVFTPREVESCGGPRAVASLAARFAAKEATIKVLRPGGEQLPWRSIEIRRHPDGWCEIELSGRAAELAASAAISHFAVSLTHEGTVAVAVVIAN